MATSTPPAAASAPQPLAPAGTGAATPLQESARGGGCRGSHRPRCPARAPQPPSALVWGPGSPKSTRPSVGPVNQSMIPPSRSLQIHNSINPAPACSSIHGTTTYEEHQPCISCRLRPRPVPAPLLQLLARAHARDSVRDLVPSAFSIEDPIPPSPPIPHTHGLPSLVLRSKTGRPLPWQLETRKSKC